MSCRVSLGLIGLLRCQASPTFPSGFFLAKRPRRVGVQQHRRGALKVYYLLPLLKKVVSYLCFANATARSAARKRSSSSTSKAMASLTP